MRVIESPQQLRERFIGRPTRCAHCKAMIEAESAADIHDVTTAFGVPMTATVTCPVCGAELAISIFTPQSEPAGREPEADTAGETETQPTVQDAVEAQLTACLLSVLGANIYPKTKPNDA